MRNLGLLMRKDFFNATLNGPSVWLMLLWWLIFVPLFPSMSGMLFVMLVYLLVIALFNNEENELVCNVLGILPIRRQQAVAARYLYAFSVLLVGFSAGVAGCAIMAAVRGTGSSWLPALLVAAASALFMVDLLLPLIYRYGVVKTRMLSYVVYIVMIVAPSVLNSFLGETSFARPDISVGLVVLLASVILSIVSLILSLHIVDKR